MSQKKNQKYYQHLTEKIARSGGLETDLRQFHDPIYRSVMMGKFANGAKRRGGWLFGPFLFEWLANLLGI